MELLGESFNLPLQFTLILFKRVLQTSSMVTFEKPRFLVIGDKASFVKNKSEPQEDALKAGDVDAAEELPKNYGKLITVSLVCRSIQQIALHFLFK